MKRLSDLLSALGYNYDIIDRDIDYNMKSIYKGKVLTLSDAYLIYKESQIGTIYSNNLIVNKDEVVYNGVSYTKDTLLHTSKFYMIDTATRTVIVLDRWKDSLTMINTDTDEKLNMKVFCEELDKYHIRTPIILMLNSIKAVMSKHQHHGKGQTLEYIEHIVKLYNQLMNKEEPTKSHQEVTPTVDFLKISKKEEVPVPIKSDKDIQIDKLTAEVARLNEILSSKEKEEVKPVLNEVESINGIKTEIKDNDIVSYNKAKDKLTAMEVMKDVDWGETFKVIGRTTAEKIKVLIGVIDRTSEATAKVIMKHYRNKKDNPDYYINVVDFSKEIRDAVRDANAPRYEAPKEETNQFQEEARSGFLF